MQSHVKVTQKSDSNTPKDRTEFPSFGDETFSRYFPGFHFFPCFPCFPFVSFFSIFSIFVHFFQLSIFSIFSIFFHVFHFFHSIFSFFPFFPCLFSRYCNTWYILVPCAGTVFQTPHLVIVAIPIAGDHRRGRGLSEGAME